MNAHEYVAKHGVEGTKECLPSYIKHYCGLERIFIDELKQVVESVEFIESYGGVDKLHEFAVSVWRSNKNDPFILRAKKAIADYELVESFKYGALTNKGTKCEVLDMVDVSPNCEVRNG